MIRKQEDITEYETLQWKSKKIHQCCNNCYYSKYAYEFFPCVGCSLNTKCSVMVGKNCINKWKPAEEELPTLSQLIEKEADRIMKKVEEDKDYSFSPAIQKALKEGKPVWVLGEHINNWKICIPDQWDLTAIYNLKWSLTKPKEMVKKYNWIYKSRHGDYYMTAAKYATKEDAMKDFTNLCLESEILEPYMPSMIEVEV